MLGTRRGFRASYAVAVLLAALFTLIAVTTAKAQQFQFCRQNWTPQGTRCFGADGTHNCNEGDGPGYCVYHGMDLRCECEVRPGTTRPRPRRSH
jgi:hypothetical protein